MRFLFLFIFFLCTFSSKAQLSAFHGKVDLHFSKGEYKEALELLDKQLYYHPNDQYSYLLRARAKEHLFKTDAALTDYNIYLEFDPENSEARFSRGVLLFEKKKYTLAIEDFKTLRGYQYPMNTSVVYFQQSKDSYSKNQMFTAQGGILSRIYYYLGLCYLEKGQNKISLSYLDSALIIENQNPDFLTSRGLAKERLGKPESSLLDYKTALQIHPEHMLARYNLSLLLANNTNYNLKDSLNSIIAQESILPYPFAQRGYIHFKDGEYLKALDDFNTALSIDPNSIDYYINRAKVYIKLERFSEAEADLNQVLGQKKTSEEAWFNLAVIAHKKSQFDEAVKLLNLAIFYYPDYTMAYVNRAIANYSLGDLQDACIDLNKAISLGFKADKKMIKAFCPH